MGWYAAAGNGGHHGVAQGRTAATAGCKGPSAGGWRVRGRRGAGIRARGRRARANGSAASPARRKRPVARVNALPSPERRALLLVDLQNDFIHPDGAYGRAGQTARAIAALPQCIAPLAAAVRAAGGLLIATQFTRVPGRGGEPIISPHLKTLRPFLGRGDFMPGAFGHALVDELAPADLTVEKVANSALYMTRLEWLVARTGISHLYVCGIVTNGGVASTVRDATHRRVRRVLRRDPRRGGPRPGARQGAGGIDGAFCRTRAGRRHPLAGGRGHRRRARPACRRHRRQVARHRRSDAGARSERGRGTDAPLACRRARPALRARRRLPLSGPQRAQDARDAGAHGRRARETPARGRGRGGDRHRHRGAGPDAADGRRAGGGRRRGTRGPRGRGRLPQPRPRVERLRRQQGVRRKAHPGPCERAVVRPRRQR